MTQAKNYKETLNLPKTSFPMKANLSQREPEMLKTWEETALYQTLRKDSAGRKKYTLHDGPPYANGHIHIGHALNKILKDIIVKYKTMTGYDSFYVPGWDCHGLPIELQCLKSMGKKKEQVERVQFRKEARAYAEKFIDIQRKEFERLGVYGEWDKPYLTMDYGYQASIAESFLKLAEQGYIYQGLKPVPWCGDCETALADAELEYEDKTSQSVYVKFPVDLASFREKMDSGNEINRDQKPVYLLVWTTTPWTLPANVGVAVHPDLDYSVLVFIDEIWILAQSRVDHLKSLKHEINEPFPRFKGKQIVGLKYRHPFVNREGRAIPAEYVSASDGTGIVHIAPGHGEEDYQFGHLQNQLDIVSPVDGRGRFTSEFPMCEGVHVFKANAMINEHLKEKGYLLLEEPCQHSYPHCWRCKKPIIFRATQQWFMKIDHEDLRKRMLEAINSKIVFMPDWGKNRIGSMVENRPEWCLSRQRFWGVPIPMIGCAKCHGRFFIRETKEAIVKIFEAEGADAWFQKKPEDFLPKGFKCPQCQGLEFTKEEDIIDVWFDSGVSHQAVLKKYPGLRYPSELYLEGSDQHRGWFQTALTTGIALDGQSPFKSVLTHGFVMDGEGKKMSKSAGNVVAPQDVMKEFGADILRLWVSSCDYQFDVRLSKGILGQLADSYRKIRNTFRYMLSNLYDFDFEKDAVPFAQSHPLDQWALGVMQELEKDIRGRYERFEFHRIYQRIHNFCVIQLSGYYFDILKDTLYVAKKDSHLRRSAQTALFTILSRLVKILAPILPFTMDEVWRSYVIEKRVVSVHQSQWQELPFTVDSKLYQVWSDIREIRDAVMPFLEKKREEKIIGASLDAKIRLWTSDKELEEVIKKNLGELPRVFVVSQVEWADGDSSALEKVSYESSCLGRVIELGIAIERADGNKCVRCWNYSLEIGGDPQFPGICNKCLEALQ
ncbi:MAG: isoleucine--tRNA ligase [Candidatus Omnitrophica bacterium]|nr:isoleucine--tRNA ligase [Candidatus Omnitrophota bacterium]